MHLSSSICDIDFFAMTTLLLLYHFDSKGGLPLHHLLKSGMSVKFHIIHKMIEMAPDTIQERAGQQ